MTEVILKNKLVAEAIELFNETKDLPNISIDDNPELFYALYDKECKLFELLGQMNETETELYQTKIALLVMKNEMERKLSEIQSRMLKLQHKSNYSFRHDWNCLYLEQKIVTNFLKLVK